METAEERLASYGTSTPGFMIPIGSRLCENALIMLE